MEFEKYKAIFTDIDGTLLNSRHRISNRTADILYQWTNSGRHLILASSRGISGIDSIIRRYNLNCSMIALGGALILDAEHNILFENGMSSQMAKEIIQFADNEGIPASWSVYTAKRWIAKDLNDLKIINESRIVEASPTGEDLSVLEDDEIVGKVLFLCENGAILAVEEKMKKRFPSLSITKSSDILLEVNPAGITKGNAVIEYCRINNIPLDQAIAFGDNFNDLSMLKVVGKPIIMGNAPAELKKLFEIFTADNDHDGIANALEKLIKH